MSTALAPLWSIEDNLLALLESVATCPDELQPELQDQIDAYLGKEVAKVDQIAHVLAALEYEQKAAADEIARLQERKKAAEGAQDRLEQYVCRVISLRGVKKLAGATNSLSVRSSDAVKITDGQTIPLKYQSVTVTVSGLVWESLVSPVVEHTMVKAIWSINKSAVKNALKAGEEVPGADLEYRDNLQRR